jgi:hypothetical protein
LFPQDNEADIAVSEKTNEPSALPSPSVLAALAGGALGLGFSVTKVVN